MFRKLAIPALVAAVFSVAAQAQDVLMYRAHDRVDPNEVARILSTPAPTERAPKMRSLKLLDAPAARAEDAEPPQPGAGVVAVPQPALPGGPVGRVAAVQGETRVDLPQARPTSLSLPVQFAFDSANILAQARSQLDALAAGIKMLPATQSVVIEGHTDAAGSDLYNLQLSMRRAVAVKQYLIAVHGIDASRLKTEGFGEYRPINEQDGFAAENRRVQFRGG
jgi:outer membrane protein OmpA-like peptidoglycan-associated protein